MVSDFARTTRSPASGGCGLDTRSSHVSNGLDVCVEPRVGFPVLLLVLAGSVGCEFESARSWHDRTAIADYLIKSNICDGFFYSCITSWGGCYGDYPLLGEVPASHEPLWRCVAEARDCEEYLECWGVVPGMLPCSVEAYPAHCDGPVIEGCNTLITGAPVQFRHDCSTGPTLRGNQCVESDSPDVIRIQCGVGTCESEGGCEGEVATWCKLGVLEELDCAGLGMSCRTAPDGWPPGHGVCVPPGVEMHEYPPRFLGGVGCACKGDILLTLETDGVSYRGADCSAVLSARKCLEEETAGEEEGQTVWTCRCGVPGNPPAPLVKRCSGRFLEWCEGDVCERYDCSTFMDATCRESNEFPASCVSEEWLPVWWR